MLAGESGEVGNPGTLGMTKGRETLPWVSSRWTEVALAQQPLSMEAPPSPLSSRAQPRDLRFHGPFVDMFFGSHTRSSAPEVRFFVTVGKAGRYGL